MTAPFTIRSAPLVAVQPPRDLDYEHIVTRLKQVGELRNLIPTRLPLFPTASAFLEIRKDIECIARHVDDLIFAYGEYIKANSGRAVDLDVFRSVLTKAIEADPLFEIEECAEHAKQQAEEAEEGDSDARHMERAT